MIYGPNFKLLWSNDRYMLFEMLQYQINYTIRKNAYWFILKTHHINSNYLLEKTRGVQNQTC